MDLFGEVMTKLGMGRGAFTLYNVCHTS